MDNFIPYWNYHYKHNIDGDRVGKFLKALGKVCGTDGTLTEEFIFQIEVRNHVGTKKYFSSSLEDEYWFVKHEQDLLATNSKGIFFSIVVNML